MPTLDDAFDAVHSALVARYGLPPSSLRAGLGAFEAICSVLLERSLGPRKADAALEGLREAEFLVPERLASADMVELIDAVARKGPSVSAGAVAPLQRLAHWLVQHHDGRIEALFDPHRSIDWLRSELASIKGIGMASADAVVLRALKRPSYPVDRATFRVLVRHGWLDPAATYDEARELLMDCASSDAYKLDERDHVEFSDLAEDLMELAHGMDQVGRHCCRPAAARCDECPLVGLLPEGGYRQIDA
ncbi:MAG: hypothetical protein ACLQIB_55065 [Isosphaeraceae bacterium]